MLETFIGTPIGAEIFFLIASLFSFTVALWILSRLMPFKKQDILTAFRVSIICAGIPFLIRSMNLIFGLPPYQAVTVNMFAMLAEIILLIILIKKLYSLGWSKTGFAWIITYGAKWATIGLIALIMLFFFTSIFAEIAEKSSEFGTLEKIQNRTNFEILQPSYLPAGYYLDNVQSPKSEMGNYVDLHYFRKEGSVTFVIALGEKLLEEEPNLQLVSPPGEEIIINETPAIFTDFEGRYDDLGITWYSKNLKLLFSLCTGTNGGLNKSELIKIAESIPK